MTCDTPQALQDALTQLAGEPSLPRRRTPLGMTVAIGSPPLQVRKLRGLPPVPQSELRALVAAHAGRYFRRNGEPLITDAAWVGPNARREGLATAAAVAEPWIEAVLVGADAAGMEVQAITPDLKGGGSMVFLSSSERVKRALRARLIDRRLSLAAAMVWVLTLAGLTARFDQGRRSTLAEIARLESPARAVAVARRSLGDAAEMAAALEEADRQRSLLLARIGLLASSLPDSAHLGSLTLDVRGNGSLSGEARRAAQAIARLEASGSIASPEPLGPITSDVESGRVWERFSVSFGSGSAR
jgi:hypothetical protein